MTTHTVLCPRCCSDRFHEIWHGWSKTLGKLRLDSSGEIEFEAEECPDYDGFGPLVYRCCACYCEVDADDLEGPG